MGISNNIRSQVLIDALPYLQDYNNKIVVIKYGGNAMTNNELKDAVMSDIVLLSLVGVKVVLVHGGGVITSYSIHYTKLYEMGVIQL